MSIEELYATISEKDKEILALQETVHNLLTNIGTGNGIELATTVGIKIGLDQAARLCSSLADSTKKIIDGVLDPPNKPPPEVLEIMISSFRNCDSVIRKYSADLENELNKPAAATAPEKKP